MKERITENEISTAFRQARSKGVIAKEDTAIVFYDLDFLINRIEDLKKSFPLTTLHAIAVKANPLIKILEKIKSLNVGLEVASLPELHLALKTGFSEDQIVFDSPSKTVAEIDFALRLGVNINADSFSELDRISALLKCKKTKSKIGVRINPQVGTGTINATSVAGKISKFGIPIENNRNKLVDYFIKHEWLNGVHLHIGSQGCSVNLLIDGVKKIYDFVIEVNEKLNNENRKINVFDIGGGLPVSYHFDKTPISLKDYKKQLETTIPELFTEEYQLITEFGRYIHANIAWAASRVEYVKREENYNIIMSHLGADFFIRKCYNPDDWHHEITILDSNGNIKKGKDKNKYIIAGPLCFAGDIIAKDIELPVVNEGYFVIIHDVGAYTLSMWSRYNSRQMPKILGYFNNGKTFELLKKREELKDLYKFWK